jgi:Helix-turn-helix domain
LRSAPTYSHAAGRVGNVLASVRVSRPTSLAEAQPQVDVDQLVEPLAEVADRGLDRLGWLDEQRPSNSHHNQNVTTNVLANDTPGNATATLVPGSQFVPATRAGVARAAGGGIRPAPRCRWELRLSLAEREETSRGLAAGLSLRRIAAVLDRAPSTV